MKEETERLNKLNEISEAPVDATVGQENRKNYTDIVRPIKIAE